MCWQQAFPLHWVKRRANLMSLGQWPWHLSARQTDVFFPIHHLCSKEKLWPFSAVMMVSPFFWKWGHITRRTTCCSRKGEDKCCTQAVSHGVCAWWWWETNHSRKRQLGLDGFDDHKHHPKPLPNMSSGNYDLAGSLFPGLLFAFIHPSRSSHKVSEHCICVEGVAAAQ